jgi:uncharacterized protein (TIGR03437 family)
MRLPTMQLTQHPLEGYFYYQWNSTRRRAHMVVILLATLLALAIYAASPRERLFAKPARSSAAANLAATLRMLQADATVLTIVPNGNDLYVGGTFTTIGGVKARGIARYNMLTGQWSTVGNDNVTNGNGVNGLVAAIAVVGNELYVGGSFTRCYNSSSSNVSANCIAKFNMQSKTWSSLGGQSGTTGNGVDGDVGTIVTHNGSVYMGGTFRRAHISTGNDVLVNGIARWNGTTWSALGKGTNTDTSTGVVNDLAVIGNDLYAGGTFTSATNTNDVKVGANHIARWSTQTNTWSALGTGLGGGSASNGVDGFVYALATDGTNLFVGGSFTETILGGSKLLVNNLARWSGSAWSVVGSSATAMGNGVESTVWELRYSAPNLYVGGEFTGAFNNGAKTSTNGIARWNGTSWTAFGSSIGTGGNGVDYTVYAITPVGDALYVGGDFTEAYNNSSSSVDAETVARWSGTSWSTLGSGGTAPKSLAAVSAASFAGTELAAESIVAAFGTGLATATQAASTTPLPTNLAGTTVSVRDSGGVTRPAQLFFVSGGQVNFLVPVGTLPGTATVTITSGDSSISAGEITIASVAPGLFTMNANGQGVVAAVALRVRGTAQTYEAVARFDTTTARWVTTPIDLGPQGDRVFLICYGSGFRGRSSLSNVSATVGGTSAPVSFAGAQGSLVGVDQGNLELPRSLAGRGEIDLVFRVDGKNANTVRINIK